MVGPINQVGLLAFVALGKWGILPILKTGNDDDDHDPDDAYMMINVFL